MADPIKILAVDDELHMLKILGMCLRAPDYEFTPCSDSTRALDIFKAGKFDVVLMDVVMPDIDGFALNAMLRKVSRSIPIIMLTAKVDDINGQMLKKLSDDRSTFYFSKNFTKPDLVSKISEVVSDSRRTIERNEYMSEMSRDLDIAGEIQTFLFPRWCSFDNKIEVSYFCRPYQKITGDFFNVVHLGDGRTLAIIGDISGHGISAALYISSLRLAVERILRLSPKNEITPNMILNKLQRFMFDISSERYMTCIVAIIDYNKGEIAFHNAGHPDFIAYSPSKGEILHLQVKSKGSIPLGILFDNVYEEKDTVVAKIPKDAIFFFYTDGITDLRDSELKNISTDDLCDLIKLVSSEGMIPEISYKLVDGLFKIGFDLVNDDISMAVLGPVYRGENIFNWRVMPMLDEADKCAQMLYTVSERFTGDKKFASEVEIVASEILNNIIVHGLGNINRTRPSICVSAEFDKGELKLHFFDKGKFFDFKDGVSDVKDACNGSVAESGRGICMVRRLSTSIMRSRFADILNETFITMKYKNV